MFIPIRFRTLRFCGGLLLFFLTVACAGVGAQSVIRYANYPGGPYFVAFNTLDCSFCPIMPAPQFNDVFVLLNGNILVRRSAFPNSQIRIFTPPSNSPIQTFGVINSGSVNFYRLDMGNPSQSVLLHSDIGVIYQDGPFGVNNGPAPGIFVADFSPGNQTLQTYDTISNTFTFQCSLAPNLGGFYNEIPPGISYDCLCFTDAGTITNQIVNRCVNEVFTFTHTGGFLENGDIWQFILFTNPNDTLGSIIATSNAPSFGFDPLVMQTGVTYYAAAIAGNDLNGNVALNDSCLDISNTTAQVTWRPQPAVVFSLANPDVCAGECTTVTATFTGIPPFTLTYNFLGNTFTQTFSAIQAIFRCAYQPVRWRVAEEMAKG